MDEVGNHLWRPAHEDHAIERAALTVQFSEPLPSKPLMAILSTADNALQQSGLLRAGDNFGFSFPTPLVPLGGAPVLQMPQAATPNGRAYLRLEGGEIREELRLINTMIMYATTRYEGWAVFRSRVEDLISESVASALHLIDVDLVKLEYWDRFTFTGSPNDAPFAGLLRPNSTHVPEFFRAHQGLWHSHMGYFVEAPPAERRLINVNVDVLDVFESAGVGSELPSNEVQGPPQTLRSAGIYTLAQDNYVKGAAPADWNVLNDAFVGMHSKLKEVFAEVISPSLARRVSLYPEEQS